MDFVDIFLRLGRNYSIVLERDGVYGYYKLPRSSIVAVLWVHQGRMRLAFCIEGLEDEDLVPTHLYVGNKCFELEAVSTGFWVLNDLAEFLSIVEKKEKVNMSFRRYDEPIEDVILTTRNFLKFVNEYTAIVKACLAMFVSTLKEPL